MAKQALLLLVTISTLLLAACDGTSETANAKTNKLQPNVKHTIPYPSDVDPTKSGASSYANAGDHFDSPYFAHPDVYNMKSNSHLTVLSHFKTYQQTTEYNCGPVAGLMVATHFGVKAATEKAIEETMLTHKDLNGNNKQEPGVANERGEWGTSTDRMLRYFNSLGWKTTSSLTEGKLDGGATFDDPTKFQAWVIENLKNNTPIMVEWIDWWGHWQNIIGYDTMGTEGFGDDVLIMADPYDTSDQYQDGYYMVPAERFFYMWGDASILPESQGKQQWVIAKPE